MSSPQSFLAFFESMAQMGAFGFLVDPPAVFLLSARGSSTSSMSSVGFQKLCVTGFLTKIGLGVMTCIPERAMCPVNGTPHDAALTLCSDGAPDHVPAVGIRRWGYGPPDRGEA